MQELETRINIYYPLEKLASLLFAKLINMQLNPFKFNKLSFLKSQKLTSQAL